MRNLSKKTRAMFDGLGIDPQDIVDGEDVSKDDMYRLSSPFPVLGRYG